MYILTIRLPVVLKLYVLFLPPQEAFIAELDAKSGASLKLTVLNPHGRIWTMVAGGGASVIYSDTICDLGGGKELANYGEYSGAPSESQTFEYAKTILKLMTKEKHPDGKYMHQCSDCNRNALVLLPTVAEGADNNVSMVAVTTATQW